LVCLKRGVNLSVAVKRQRDRMNTHKILPLRELTGLGGVPNSATIAMAIRRYKNGLARTRANER
jgi:hypothetical protein